MGGWPWPLDSVQGFFESFWKHVTDSVAGAVRAISDGLTAAVGAIQNGLASAVAGILGALQVAQDVVLGAVQGAFGVVEDAIGSIGETIANGLRALWDGFTAALSAAVAFLKDRVLQPIVDGIAGLLAAAVETMKTIARSGAETILAMAPHSPGGGLDAGLVALGLGAGLQVAALVGATIGDAVHPFHSLEVKQTLIAAFGATGVSSIGPAVLSRILDVAILKPMVQELNEVYVRELPGPSDLVRFVVREQITPDELELWLKRQGFGPKWSTAFWGAHWVVPSREEAVELYHRGAYTLQQVTDNLVVNDRRPDTIPDLLALTFRTPSRTELERIVEVQDVGVDVLDSWLRADGVSEELLPVYRTLVRGRRLVRILTRVETLVRTEVQAGRLQEAEARGILQEYRFAPEVVEAEIALAKRARDLELRDELRGIAVEAFRKGEITDGDLASDLQEIGLDPDRVGTIVALEKIRKRPKAKVPPAP